MKPKYRFLGLNYKFLSIFFNIFLKKSKKKQRRIQSPNVSYLSVWDAHSPFLSSPQQD